MHFHLHTARRLWRRLNPKIPRSMFAGIFLLPDIVLSSKKESLKLHRQTFYTALAHPSNLIGLLLFLYGYSRWILVFAWLQSFRAWRKRSQKIEEQQGVSRVRQFCDLLTLALVYTAPPRCYYRYKLYRYTKPEWFEFVYTHELPQWHHLMSPHVSNNSNTLLSDKILFAQHMLQKHIPAVAEYSILPRSSKVDTTDIFKAQSLFFKPVTGSRKQGCYILNFIEETGTYMFSGFDSPAPHKHEDIIRFVNKLCYRQDYLIQPLLVNHAWFTGKALHSALVTLRVVTAAYASGPVCVSAIMELPTHSFTSHVYCMGVDLSSGILSSLDHSTTDQAEYKQACELFEGEVLPQWLEIKKIAESAHKQCLDIATIGWDLALTDCGIRLLEGNFNWSVEPHQLNGPKLMPVFYALKLEQSNLGAGNSKVVS